jgi:PTH1 family peptidyl-tRNA hydrolase
VRILLALGNPGDRYRDTRHNAGWWLADRLAVLWKLPGFAASGPTAWTFGRVLGSAVEIHKPLTYMNRSGPALAGLLATRDIDPGAELLVLVDDVWLPPGRIRLRRSGSAGGHNGLASVSEALGGDEYARLRIGVGRPGDDRIDLAEWVLTRMPRAAEEATLATFARAAAAVEDWLDNGIDAAMSRANET